MVSDAVAFARVPKSDTLKILVPWTVLVTASVPFERLKVPLDVVRLFTVSVSMEV
jgi:hypothetical protein